VTVPGACTDSGSSDAGHDSGTDAADTGTGGPAGTLWVTDNFAGTPTPTPSILGFSLAEAVAGGNVAPKTTISGAKTTMTGPGCVAFDASGNMWVVDSLGSKQAGQILEFTAADVATGGNVAPAVTISGANTQLTNPAGCAFDSNGTLWMAVIDNSTPNVVAFTAAQLATGGNISPAVDYGNGCNTIDVAFDPTGDLWVSALCTGVQEYTKAELTDGGASPTPALTFGEATGVNGIVFDSSGNLWSTLQGGINAVTEYTPTALAAATPVP
jgi:sugar lactone lactonase YvrE